MFSATEQVCSLECAEKIDALRGALFGRTTFKSILGKFAGALADYRRAHLEATLTTRFNPTVADLKRLQRIAHATGDTPLALLEAALAIGSMIAAVRTPNARGDSKVEGEEVNRAVENSFNSWIKELPENEPNFPNNMFTELAMKVAVFMGGYGSVNETFSNMLALLRNYCDPGPDGPMLNSATADTRRKDFVKGAEAQGEHLDKAYQEYADSLKKKAPK